jgi:hypothetical protein
MDVLPKLVLVGILFMFHPLLALIPIVCWISDING